MTILDEDLKNKILKRITPTKDEVKELKILVDVFKQKLYGVAKSKNYVINIELGGSYAKNTFLKGDFDIDFFIQFSSSIEDKKKEEILVEILGDAKINFNIKHGSRLYVSGFFSNFSNNHLNNDINSSQYFGFNFECVPTEICDDVTKAKNSTDISIFHVKYLQKKIQENPKLIDEIRLTKKWFKTQKLYGAESYINGFSGHSIECLIMKFKTFENLIIFFSQMKKGDILVIDEYNSNKISFSKDKESPLMIQDPILEGRNALSALSDEQFYRAKYIAIQSLQYGFKEKDFLSNKLCKNLKDLRKVFFEEKLDFVGIEYTIKKTNLSRDILGSKLLKLSKKISKLLKSNGFSVISLSFEMFEEESVAFTKIIVEHSKLPKKYVSKAISLDVSQDHIINFLQTHKHSTLRLINNFLYVEKQRNFSTLSEFKNLYLNNSQYLNEELNIEEFVFLSDFKFITNKF
ncbi:MAG: nucleotidyltransferase domain-containing protein [Nanoarchaeota archaeon]|nr:nucleotidyltransferase domain-containing protein [Nanoarchaeota archaeon]